MANVTRERTGTLLRALFQILKDHPDGLRARDALEQLRHAVTMTEYESGTYAAGALRFDKIVRFATIDCVKAGWLLKRKGIWSVTDTGREAFNAYPAPGDFYRRAVELYREWKATQEDDVDDEVDDESTEEIDASITYEQAEELAWAEISAHMVQKSPYEFQDLVADLLKAMGYHISWVAPPGKDGGIDIVAFNDPIGARPPRIKVQVKRQSTSVAVGELRSFLAILGTDEVGLFVSANGFTKDAEIEARSQQKSKITLIDLQQLFELWVQYYDKLDDVAKRRLPLRPIHFLSPEL